jgi:Mn-dependent DtxR family transcriptional regulator
MLEAKAEPRTRIQPRGNAADQSSTVNRYLEAIYYIDGEGESVRAARLADWLGVSQPTAGATIQRMKRDGLVEISTAKVISLTRAGRKAAGDHCSEASHRRTLADGCARVRLGPGR